MKLIAILFLILAASAMFGQTLPLHDDTAMSHEYAWKPEMCSQLQWHATKRFVTYCLKQAPTAEPACLAPRGPVPTEILQRAKDPRMAGMIYFEPHDCAYHAGLDPRKSQTVAP
jgi:hypothetical protein